MALSYFVGEFGTYPMPYQVARMFGNAQLRRDGKPDRRTRGGKRLAEWEDRELKRERDYVTQDYFLRPAGFYLVDL